MLTFLMRTFFWVPAVLAVALPAVAQSSTRLQPVPDRSPGCPVAVHAERRMSGAVMQARDGGKPVTGQRISLELEPDSQTAIPASAEVTVHGTRAEARVTMLTSSSAAKASTEATKNFTVTPGNPGAKMISDLVLEGFTSVQSISLDSVTFMDGSMWKAAKSGSCSVIPDPMMLVSRR